MTQNLSGRAAVLVLSQGVGVKQQVLFVKRAQHLRMHAGEMAFPGGKWEPHDPDLMHTALREVQEETNISPTEVQLVGDLPSGYTGKGIHVQPFVGQVAEGIKAYPCNEEISECIWLKYDQLVTDRRVRTDIYLMNGREYWSPAYDFDGNIVWGFTARVLVEFMRRFWGIELAQNASSAPVFRYKL